MKNTLAENMLRFGSKNLSEASKETLQKLAEQEMATDKKVLPPNLVNDQNAIIKMASKLEPYVSTKTGIMYIPKNIGSKINAQPESITAYGITINIYPSPTSGVYTFPVLTVIGNIDVRLAAGKILFQGLSSIDLSKVVNQVKFKENYDVNIIPVVQQKDAPTWNMVSSQKPFVTQFITINKNKLGSLDTAKLSMKNEITKGVYAKPTPEILASKDVINMMGGSII
jgi:hypothetical protein